MRDSRREMADGAGLDAIAELRRRRMFLDGCELEEQQLLDARRRANTARQEHAAVVESAKESLREAQRAFEAIEKHVTRLRQRRVERRRSRVARQRDEVATRVWRENRHE
jgi:hypothetical protein